MGEGRERGAELIVLQEAPWTRTCLNILAAHPD
jgi:hypothetical protein